MSVHSEVNNIFKNRSIDASINYHSRSGESKNGGSMLDIYAHTESAEFDIVTSEEREERQKYLRAFGLYLKKILTKKELAFFIECLKNEETPAKIGARLGLDWYKTVESINYKYAKYENKLLRLLKHGGFNIQNASFAHNLNKYAKERKYLNAKSRAYRAKHREKIKAINCAYYAAHSEEILARQRAYNAKHREKIRANWRARYVAHSEEIKAKYRVRRAEHREEINAKQRAYNAKHREKIRANWRAYRAKHREEINAKQRALYAKKKEAKQ